mmetsp:Transcript_104889/g.266373  ORF Transcript_104889/g.266373 Transcript_104889/m.266373 type:complete len:243 (+) Transcript_104889:146-874(+)
MRLGKDVLLEIPEATALPADLFQKGTHLLQALHDEVSQARSNTACITSGLFNAAIEAWWSVKTFTFWTRATAFGQDRASLCQVNHDLRLPGQTLDRHCRWRRLGRNLVKLVDTIAEVGIGSLLVTLGGMARTALNCWRLPLRNLGATRAFGRGLAPPLGQLLVGRLQLLEGLRRPLPVGVQTTCTAAISTGDLGVRCLGTQTKQSVGVPILCRSQGFFEVATQSGQTSHVRRCTPQQLRRAP